MEMEIEEVVPVGTTQAKGSYTDTLLFTGTIRIGVPYYRQVLQRRRPDDPIVIRLQRPLTGGSLGLYITTRDPDKYSEEPRVMRIELYHRRNKRTHTEHFFGRLFDTKETKPSHTLVVHEHISWQTPPPSHERFVVPEPLVGEIVLIPLIFPQSPPTDGVAETFAQTRPDIRDRERMPVKDKSERKGPEAYLKKLLSEGWHLDKRDGRDCTLSRKGKKINYRVPKK